MSEIIFFSASKNIFFCRNDVQAIDFLRKGSYAPERLRPECNGLYQGRNYKTKFSVMFWGCISCYGVGTLTSVVGNLNSEKYINMLDDNLWPVIAQHFPTSPYIF